MVCTGMSHLPHWDCWDWVGKGGTGVSFIVIDEKATRGVDIKEGRGLILTVICVPFLIWDHLNSKLMPQQQWEAIEGDNRYGFFLHVEGWGDVAAELYTMGAARTGDEWRYSSTPLCFTPGSEMQRCSTCTSCYPPLTSISVMQLQCSNFWFMRLCFCSLVMRYAWMCTYHAII